jgi:hypothetical protein
VERANEKGIIDAELKFAIVRSNHHNVDLLILCSVGLLEQKLDSRPQSKHSCIITVEYCESTKYFSTKQDGSSKVNLLSAGTAGR